MLVRFDLQVSVFASRFADDALVSGSPTAATTGGGVEHGAEEDTGVTAPDGRGDVSSPVVEPEPEEPDPERDFRDMRRFRRSRMAMLESGCGCG